MSIYDKYYFVKTTFGYKSVEHDVETATHAILPAKDFVYITSTLDGMYTEVHNLKNKLLEKGNLACYYENRCNELMDKIYSEYNDYDVIKKENEQLKAKNIELTTSYNSMLKIYKQKANAEKGQYPKKQHTGYSLINSYCRDYLYYHHGNRRKTFIHESVFQTPYPLDVNYDDANDMVEHDLLSNDDGSLSSYLGIDEVNITGWYEKILDIYRQTDFDELNILYNFNLRMNGRERYWEVVLNHTKSLGPPPNEIMFQKRNTKKR